MSIFDGKRLTNETFKLDIDRMRRGWYSDKYFANINIMLVQLAAEGYYYVGKHHNLPAHISPDNIAVGDMEVEMQWFTRRIGPSLVVGVDKVLTMLKHCTADLRQWCSRRYARRQCQRTFHCSGPGMRTGFTD